MKKLIYFILIIIGLILIVLGNFFLDRKEVKTPKLNQTEKQEKQLVENQLSNLIQDSLSKTSSGEELFEKYQIEGIKDVQLPFSSVNILRFGLNIEPSDEIKECQDFVQKNYELVHKRYVDSFGYEAEVDLDNKAVSIKIKSMFLESYITEFSDMTLEIIDASRAELIETFIARCKILKEVQPRLKRYDNDEYNTTVRITYELIDGKVKFLNYIEVLNALQNKGEPNPKKQKSREEFIKQISDKIKKEEK